MDHLHARAERITLLLLSIQFLDSLASRRRVADRLQLRLAAQDPGTSRRAGVPGQPGCPQSLDGALQLSRKAEGAGDVVARDGIARDKPGALLEGLDSLLKSAGQVGRDALLKSQPVGPSLCRLDLTG